jgi:hypothetical protein
MAEKKSWEFFGWYGPYGHNALWGKDGKFTTVVAEVQGVGEFDSIDDLKSWIRQYYDWWDGPEETDQGD